MALTAEAVEAPPSGSIAAPDPNSVNAQTDTDLFVTTFVLFNLILSELLIESLPYYKEVSPLLRFVLIYLQSAISLVGVLYVAPPLFSSAWKRIKLGEFSADLCKLLAVIIGTVYLVYSLLHDVESVLELNLTESLVLVLFILALERFITRKTVLSLNAQVGFNLRTWIDQVRVFEGIASVGGAQGQLGFNLRIVSPELVKCGDIIASKEGEFIGLDGVVVNGLAEVRERVFTGAAVSRFKAPGDKVFAGSEIVYGELHYRAQNEFEDSTITTFSPIFDRSVAEVIEQERKTSVLEQLLAGGLLFISACAGLYWNEQDGGLKAVTLGMQGILLLSIFSPTVFKIIPALKSRLITEAFMRGVVVAEASIFDRLARVRGFIFDHLPGQVPSPKLIDFEILDQRIDQGSLISLIIAVFSRSSEKVSEAICAALRSKIERPLLYNICDYVFYEGGGISASVEGVEVSCGSESFLIQRGVQLQGSDLLECRSAEEIIYIAIAEEVVARVKVLYRDEELVPAIRSAGLRPSFFSMAGENEIDRIGKSFGFELADIVPVSNTQAVDKRLENSAPLIVVTNKERDFFGKKESVLTAGAFDELLFEINSRDITLFGDSLSTIPWIVKAAQRLVKFTQITQISAATLCAIGILVSFTSYYSPLLIGVISLFSLTALYSLIIKKS